MTLDEIKVLNHEQVQARLRDISKEMENEDADLESLGKEVDALNERNADLANAEQRKANMRDMIAKGLEETVDVKGQSDKDAEARSKKAEQRKRDLLEKRSITVGSSDLLVPKHYGNNINDTFNEVSTLVDKIRIESLPNGESYSEAFLKGYGKGGIVEEGADYAEAEPVFDYADMTKVKITAYASFTEETRKLPAADYVSKITSGMNIALRKVLSAQVIKGSGSNEFMGIFGTPDAIDSAKDLTITAIDEDTLNEIIFAYGGDEDVESPQVLILNKKTLKAFSEVKKGDNSGPAYDIDLARQTINTIPYIINSNVDDFSTASAGGFVMAYGDLNAYKAVQFSPMEIRMSDSDGTNFRKGIDAYRASVFVAGNVVKYNGFLRVKKG